MPVDLDNNEIVLRCPFCGTALKNIDEHIPKILRKGKTYYACSGSCKVVVTKEIEKP
jgi:YHS domain-containing protein